MKEIFRKSKEIVFSDGKTSKSEIIKAIDSASKSIKIAMAFFTDKEIAGALINAKSKGVTVQIVLSDSSNNLSIKEKLDPYAAVVVHEIDGRGIMHHKFCIVDDQKLLHGSYNYTYNALNNNAETLNYTESKELVAQYITIFEDLWKEASLIVKEKDSSIELIKESKDENNDVFYLDKFTNELKNHISQIFDDYNEDEILNNGFELSKKSDGSVDLFVTELDAILTDVKENNNQEDYKKVIVKTKMAASLDRAIETNNENLNSEVKLLTDFNVKKIEILTEEQSELKAKMNLKKETLTELNNKIADCNAKKGSLNSDVEHIDLNLLVNKFWQLPTIALSSILIVLFFYLNLFFASAYWKMLFEADYFQKLNEQGNPVPTATIIEANAYELLFGNIGFWHGVVGIVFCLIPLSLTNLNLFYPHGNVLKKWHKISYKPSSIFYFVGLLLLDVAVAIIISKNNASIEALKTSAPNNWGLSEVFFDPTFYMTFAFGAFPLVLFSFMMDSIAKAYKNSKPELVDREKYLKKQSIEKEISTLDQEIEVIKTKVDIVESEIENIEQEVLLNEKKINQIKNSENETINEIGKRIESRNIHLKNIYNSYLASVDSGKKLYLSAIEGIITAFKKGFFMYLTDQYRDHVAQQKIEILENSYKNWANTNFK